MKPDHPCLSRIIEEELIDYRIHSRFYHPDYVKRQGLSGAERILEFGSCGGAFPVPWQKHSSRKSPVLRGNFPVLDGKNPEKTEGLS